MQYSLPICEKCSSWRKPIAQRSKSGMVAILMTCHAYPSGIPDRYTVEASVHDSIQKDQLGSFIFDGVLRISKDVVIEKFKTENDDG